MMDDREFAQLLAEVDEAFSCAWSKEWPYRERWLAARRLQAAFREAHRLRVAIINAAAALNDDVPVDEVVADLRAALTEQEPM